MSQARFIKIFWFFVACQIAAIVVALICFAIKAPIAEAALIPMGLSLLGAMVVLASLIML